MSFVALMKDADDDATELSFRPLGKAVEQVIRGIGKARQRFDEHEIRKEGLKAVKAALNTDEPFRNSAGGSRR